MTSKDEYEKIIFDHDFQKDTILKALDVVKKFIISNKRVLTGGMAIDIALRSKGTHLYSDNKIPDYDFFSPTFHIDAYTIGEQLVELGLPNVSVVRAFHISTMRVSVNNVWVADIGYIPQNVYDKLPTMTHMGFTIVHPHYQMIDQHRALSLPYENAPLETIMGRWSKDIERYDLLNKYFPIDRPVVKSADPSEYELKTSDMKGHCVAGITSLLHWIQAAEADGMKVKHKLGSISVSDKIIKVVQPLEFPLSIMTDDYDSILDLYKTSSHKYYNAFADKLPRRMVIEGHTGNVEVIDNKGQMVAATKLTDEIYVSGLQGVMCYLLTHGTFYGNQLALYAYSIAQEILFWASEQYCKDLNEKYLKYLPLTETYGKYNWYPAYIHSRHHILVQLKDAKKKDSVPRNVYYGQLTSGKPDPSVYEFQPAQSEYYQFDGEPTGRFEPLVLPE